MAGVKSLVKETVIYGLSSIIGRFLNWCLVPLYVYLFPAEEYGVVSYLYSFTAVMLVILNYGMETGFFRFVNREDEREPMRVYSTSLISVGVTSSLFILFTLFFLQPLSTAIKLPDHSLYVGILAVITAIDAFCNLPFAYLRYCKRPIRFAAVKLTNITLSISLNVFFLWLCPKINSICPAAINWFYAPFGGEDFGIGWIFIANLIATLVVLLMLFPELRGFKWKFSWPLLRKMLSYSWPLLILGVAGIMSQNMGQMVIPWLFDNASARQMVGIYGANIKIAIVMVMFTQAFRYAYEPYIFARAKEKGDAKLQVYSDAMKFFIIFGLFIFLGVMFFLPLLKYFVSSAYWSGLSVVPLMMIAELFFGIFFNLSLWYKLTDRTRWGMYLSIICFLLMLGFNLWLVPAIGIPDGYLGSAWAALISYFLVMCISYIVGRHYYPLPYPLGKIAIYTAIAALFYVAGDWLDFDNIIWLTYLSRSLLLAVYIGIVYFGEFASTRGIRLA